MDSLLSDLLRYLKENPPKRGRFLSLFADQFTPFDRPQVKKKSQMPIKVTPPKPSSPPVKQELPPEEIVVIEKKLPFSIEKADASKKGNSLDLKGFYSKHAPSLQVYEQPKNDAIAKKAKAKSVDQKLFSDLIVFTDKELATFNPFLTSIAQAIEVKFFPCKLIDITMIEKEDRWINLLTSPGLKMVLIPAPLLFRSPKLLVHYKEIGEKSLLGEIPCLKIEHLESLQKHPEKKKELWSAITKKISHL